MIDNSEIKVKSLQKALEILNLFADKPVLGVTEISEYFGIYKSTVHNILSTLKAMEYLEQDEETGKYRLGIQVFTLSKALGDTYSITKIATPYLQELSNQTRERVYLAVRTDQKFCIWIPCIRQILLTDAFNSWREGTDVLHWNWQSNAGEYE